MRPVCHGIWGKNTGPQNQESVFCGWTCPLHVWALTRLWSPEAMCLGISPPSLWRFQCRCSLRETQAAFLPCLSKSQFLRVRVRVHEKKCIVRVCRDHITKADRTRGRRKEELGQVRGWESLRLSASQSVSGSSHHHWCLPWHHLSFQEGNP